MVSAWNHHEAHPRGIRPQGAVEAGEALARRRALQQKVLARFEGRDPFFPF